MIAGLIGLLDDIYTLGGKIKPTLLILAAILIIFGRELFPSLYDPKLYFPIFSSTGTHLVIYSILILASIPVLANAFNMMDAFNGEISGFTFITSLALVFAALLRAYALSDYSVVRIAAILPLVAVSLAFFVYNRYPSRIFSGDSGSLTFGAMYAALAIIGGVEFAALVAVIPAILNSFFILSSVKRVVEHKRIIIRPTYLGEDGRLYANDQPRAPTTLARMLLLDGPLTEQEIVSRVFTLTIFSSILSVTTSTLTWLT
jgi:UDP-N-acetylglucosamine--dolichyl-phosphate N-acetylglucosaminephosphotransferase